MTLTLIFAKCVALALTGVALLCTSASTEFAIEQYYDVKELKASKKARREGRYDAFKWSDRPERTVKAINIVVHVLVYAFATYGIVF